ncbi:DUF3126 family protein [Polycladidibacter hongkongensis]|uniref:DUF3126 family protein n=1 Tax=Polycladidibacter hongkongensis TaxID=1647556 RepID=UPI00083127A1|nr:DUF3126 family protein [Pseudovibrio hongkongensis]
MNAEEIRKLQAFLRKTFGNQNLSVRGRSNKDDSCEVYVGDEFLGVIFRDEEDGETSWNFQMAVLEIDLEDL